MNRRECLALLGSTGTVALAGCGTLGGAETLSEPTVHEESKRRRSLVFSANGEEVANFGADGFVGSELIKLQTELWHRQDTHVQSIALRVWMPDAETPADVAVVSPVEGDSSPPPTLHLRSPRRTRGTIIEIEDLDDLKDETISTIDLLVRPRSTTATTLLIDATIELTSQGWLGSDYTLDGQLELEFPGFGDE